jgi:nicotinamide riboside kinase
MNLGITGAQSVGKTTLLNALRSEKALTGFTVCDEVTRRVKSYGLPINEAGTNVTQRLIMQEHIANVFMHHSMITDRTALDGLVYSSYLFKKGSIDASTMKFVRQVFDKVWPAYDHVFYIAPEFDIADDGERSVSTDFRDEIVEIFETIIKTNKLPVIRIKGSVRERVSTIINILEGR